jgi:AcrR family transcriptional regulator
MPEKRTEQSPRGDKETKSVWLRPTRTTRQDPPLTRQRIVEEAVALLDEQGIEGLTMRRLAERLGSGVTTLYWHVENKDDVLDLALDSIFAQLPASSDADTSKWRDQIVALLIDWRASMLRHPWSATLLQRPALGPNLLDRLEFLQAVLSKAGLSGTYLTASTWTLYNYVMGATVARASFDLSAGDRTRAQQRLQEMSDRYPTLSATDHLLQDDWNGTFAQGLQFVLDGIGGAIRHHEAN